MHAADPGPVDRAITAICRVVLWLSTSVIFAILVANTVLRYATGSSLQWANEVPELLFPWLVMAGVVLAALRGAHITTSFLVEKLPQAARQASVMAGWLLVTALYATLAWATWRITGASRLQRSLACGQRGWKVQPEGGFSGLGTSPATGVRARPVMPRSGIASSSIRV